MLEFKYLLIILFVSFSAFGQTEYKSNDGEIYKVGDTLEIGQPISIGYSPSITVGGHWKTIFNMKGKNSNNSNLINKSIIITKIETVDGITRFLFRIFSSNFYVNIEEALAKGEIIKDYKTKNKVIQNDDKYDKLKKIKELYDSGALTKEEFDIEKTKILKLEE